MNKIYESVSVFKLSKLINKDKFYKHHFHHLDSIAKYSSRNFHLQFSIHYLDSHLHHVDTLPRSVKRECSTYSYGLNELTIYTPVVPTRMVQ